MFENLDPKPKWITVMSDNGPHYHCTELMLIIGQWKDWYDIVPQKWIFLEAGEAKTLIDSHHAQVVIVLFALFYYMFYYYFGDDIETAIHDIAGTKVANLMPNRNQGIPIIEEIIKQYFCLSTIIFILRVGKEKIGTIAGIKSLHEWTWPV